MAHCVAKAINIERLERVLAKRQKKIERQPEVAVVDHGAKGRCFYFANGAIVTWNIPRLAFQEYLNIALPYCEGLLSKSLVEGYSYRFGSKVNVRPHEYFYVDILTLDEDAPELMLAMSFAFARSIKLKVFEQVVEEIIDKCSPVISDLASRGKTKLSRRAIQKINGQIVENKSYINLKSDYAYHPKFFWHHPNLEPYYILLQRYLDIPQRVDALNQKWEMLNDIFTMLKDHLEIHHSHFLEIIIIVLLVMEVASSMIFHL